MPTSDWLTPIIRDAPSAGRCINMSCTTCGAGPFKEFVHEAAIAELARQPGLRAHLLRLTDEDIIRTIIAGMRQLPEDLVETDAAQILFREYFDPSASHGVSISLSEALEGTPAGRAHSNWLFWVIRSYGDFVDYQRKEAEIAAAAAERRRLKREATKVAVAQRAEAKLVRDAARASVLAELEALEPIERLRRIATDLSLDLNLVPVALVPIEALQSLGPRAELATKLLDRIGHRAGPWRQIARAIRSRGR